MPAQSLFFLRAKFWQSKNFRTGSGNILKTRENRDWFIMYPFFSRWDKSMSTQSLQRRWDLRGAWQYFYVFLPRWQNGWQMWARSIGERSEGKAFRIDLIIRPLVVPWLHLAYNYIIFNIASGSEVNITTSCEMEIFNFLWLIWDHYLTLHPT